MLLLSLLLCDHSFSGSSSGFLHFLINVYLYEVSAPFSVFTVCTCCFGHPCTPKTLPCILTRFLFLGLETVVVTLPLFCSVQCYSVCHCSRSVLYKSEQNKCILSSQSRDNASLTSCLQPLAFPFCFPNSHPDPAFFLQSLLVTGQHANTVMW